MTAGQVLIGLTVLMLFGASLAAGGDAIEAGDVAPPFSLVGSDGATHSLADSQGKVVVLAWFPKAFTRGCTIECKGLKESGEALREYPVDYFAASVDDAETNAQFAASLEVDYPILSDPTRESATAYGVLAEEGYANRWTFYIGADGRVLFVDRDVHPESAAKDIMARLDELGVLKTQS